MVLYGLRQTPSFGLTSPGKHTVMPDTTHIEYSKEQARDHQSDNDACDGKPQDHDDQHHRNRHHVHSPFHGRSHDHHLHLHKNRKAESVSGDLPFFPATEVEEADGNDGSPIWIVIDDIIYDVTNFANEHPGGAMPLKNLAGKSCSWQFHKIHNRKTLEVYGSKLRVGRTTDVPNPHKEPRPQLFRQLWQSHHF